MYSTFKKISIVSLIGAVLLSSCSSSTSPISQNTIPAETLVSDISKSDSTSTKLAITQPYVASTRVARTTPPVPPANQLLEEAKEFYSKGQYQVTINIIDTIHREYLGSPEDVEAQTLKSLAEEQKKVSDNEAMKNNLEIESANKKASLEREKAMKRAEDNRDEEMLIFYEAEALFNQTGDLSALIEFSEKYPYAYLMNQALKIIDDNMAEHDKQKSDQEEAAKAAKDSIRITKFKKSKPNSVGGVDVFIGFKNLSSKTIKEVTFNVHAYDAVGDIVSCEVTDKEMAYLSSIGPYKKGKGESGDSGYWSDVWYNSTIDRIELFSINIEYMDGSHVTFSEGLDGLIY